MAPVCNLFRPPAPVRRAGAKELPPVRRNANRARVAMCGWTGQGEGYIGRDRIPSASAMIATMGAASSPDCPDLFTSGLPAAGSGDDAGGYRVSHDCGAVTVGNEAPIWQDRCRVSPATPLALTAARKRYGGHHRRLATRRFCSRSLWLVTRSLLTQHGQNRVGGERDGSRLR
jgi:hypothetical protein